MGANSKNYGITLIGKGGTPVRLYKYEGTDDVEIVIGDSHAYVKSYEITYAIETLNIATDSEGGR